VVIERVLRSSGATGVGDGHGDLHGGESATRAAWRAGARGIGVRLRVVRSRRRRHASGEPRLRRVLQRVEMKQPWRQSQDRVRSARLSVERAGGERGPHVEGISEGRSLLGRCSTTRRLPDTVITRSCGRGARTPELTLHAGSGARPPMRGLWSSSGGSLAPRGGTELPSGLRPCGREVVRVAARDRGNSSANRARSAGVGARRTVLVRARSRDRARRGRSDCRTSRRVARIHRCCRVSPRCFTRRRRCGTAPDTDERFELPRTGCRTSRACRGSAVGRRQS